LQNEGQGPFCRRIISHILGALFSLNEYQKLKQKYGNYSSWAIWDYQNEANTKIIDTHYKQLQSRYVFLALNISAPLNGIPWQNFHGGKHDRKLKYACTCSELKGAYITDLFKDIPEVKSSNLSQQLNKEIVAKNVDFFNQEMKDIKLKPDSILILLGAKSSLLSKMYEKYFKLHYSNPVINYYHYSYYRLTDQQWVEDLWEKLELKNDFRKIKTKYL